MNALREAKACLSDVKAFTHTEHRLKTALAALVEAVDGGILTCVTSDTGAGAIYDKRLTQPGQRVRVLAVGRSPMTNDNPRGLPVVSPWDVLDAATRGEEWVTFGELKRAREQLATDYAAIVAERDALRVDARRLDWLDSQRGDDVQCDRNGDPELVAHYWSVYDQCYDVRTAIDAAIAAQQAEGES